MWETYSRLAQIMQITQHARSIKDELTVKAETAVICEHLSVILSLDERTIPTTAVCEFAVNLIESDPCFAPEVLLQGPSPSVPALAERHSEYKRTKI